MRPVTCMEFVDDCDTGAEASPDFPKGRETPGDSRSCPWRSQGLGESDRHYTPCLDPVAPRRPPPYPEVLVDGAGLPAGSSAGDQPGESGVPSWISRMPHSSRSPGTPSQNPGRSRIRPRPAPTTRTRPAAGNRSRPAARPPSNRAWPGVVAGVAIGGTHVFHPDRTGIDGQHLGGPLQVCPPNHPDPPAGHGCGRAPDRRLNPFPAPAGCRPRFERSRYRAGPGLVELPCPAFPRLCLLQRRKRFCSSEAASFRHGLPESSLKGSERPLPSMVSGLRQSMPR